MSNAEAALRGKKVLVTGAGGFIGSRLTERLVELGAEVRALVHYNSLGAWGWLDDSPHKREIEILAGDIADPGCVQRAVEGREVVFHLAALIAIPYSYLAPASYVRVNIEGALNVLEAARRWNIERLVHTSTSEVYGTALRTPINEDHPLQGQSPYSATKIAADKLVESYYRSFDVPAVTVRPFNTYGPRQSARAVVPTIITQALTQPTIRLGNLTATRDLNFVDDTVRGFLCAAVTPQAIGQTINIGSGREIAIGELARLILRMTESQASIESDEQRVRPAKSEVERLLADNTRAKQLLGWSPTVSLEDGLQRTIAWLRDHLGRYRPDVYNI